MGDTELVCQLRQERELIMSQLRGVENGMRNYGLALVSAIAGFTYFYLKGEWAASAIPREWLLFALVQFAFFLCLAAVAMLAAVCTYSGYVRALEDRINSLSDSPTAVWMNGAWKRFGAMPYGAFFWCWVVIDAAVLAALLGVMVMFIVSVSSLWMRTLTVLEFPIGVSFVLWARIDLDRSEKFSRNLLMGQGLPRSSPQKDKE